MLADGASFGRGEHRITDDGGFEQLFKGCAVVSGDQNAARPGRAGGAQCADPPRPPRLLQPGVMTMDMTMISLQVESSPIAALPWPTPSVPPSSRRAAWA